MSIFTALWGDGHSTHVFFYTKKWDDFERSITGQSFGAMRAAPRFLLEKKSPLAAYFSDTEWAAQLAYLCDIFSLFKKLNLSLQGRKTTVFKSAEKVAAFKYKLEVEKWQMNTGIFDMFQTLAEIFKETELAPYFFLQLHDQLTQLSKEFDHSVQFSYSVMSDSLCLHGLQHTRPSCPSSTPRVYSSSCASSRWCHPTMSSSVIPFSSCPQSLPASGSFQISQFFASGGKSIGVSASTSVLPMNT